jgi:hypothetical protein
MVDELSSWSPRHLVNIHEQDEIRYWTQTLDVTEEQLRRAVGAVGSDADAIRRFFAGTADRTGA